MIDARDGAALDGRGAACHWPRHAGPIVTDRPATSPTRRTAPPCRARPDVLGGPDLLVNNAGTLGASPLPAIADFPLAELRAAFEVNVIAPRRPHPAAAARAARRGGAVLNITSDAAVEAYAGWGGYGAAKAALEQACNVLAAEENTVRVWWVDPGDLRTRMHQDAFPGEDISDRPLPEYGGARRSAG